MSTQTPTRGSAWGWGAAFLAVALIAGGIFGAAAKTTTSNRFGDVVRSFNWLVFSIWGAVGLLALAVAALFTTMLPPDTARADYLARLNAPLPEEEPVQRKIVNVRNHG